MGEFWDRLLQAGGEILVLIGLAIVGVSFELVMASKIKAWKKTALFLLFTEGIAAAIGCMAWYSWRQGSSFGSVVVIAVVAVLLSVGFLIGGIWGHRKGWKQKDEW